VIRVVLLSTYEMGRQPLGLASPAAWLEREGCTVRCIDLSLDELDSAAVAAADLVAFHLPMHTATRLAAQVVPRVRAANPCAHLCFYGLYASPNEDYLRRLGGRTILGGEFESGLVELARRLGRGTAASDPPLPVVSLERQRFVVPRRDGLPALDRYARLESGEGSRSVGYTEASRGCKYSCRHCPVVPVYGGRFRVVDREVVLEDIRRQVAAGAAHVTFGDPDFFNGPTHSMRIVEQLHREFPDLSYDVTIKIEHLLEQRRHLAGLRETGCLFVTTAVESVDDRVLEILDKGHTRAGFVEAMGLMREVGLAVNPTFVAFTPWLTRSGYLDLLRTILELDLVDHVAPVQYAIRLLVTPTSKLLELDEMQPLVGEFDSEGLVWPWVHPDPGVDKLQEQVLNAVHEARHQESTRREVFLKLWELAQDACDRSTSRSLDVATIMQAVPRVTVPYLTEPWYC
jgi:radical SAM superfamily enzyme YgiQ (UPF0313 family)